MVVVPNKKSLLGHLQTSREAFVLALFLDAPWPGWMRVSTGTCFFSEYSGKVSGAAVPCFLWTQATHSHTNMHTHIHTQIIMHPAVETEQINSCWEPISLMTDPIIYCRYTNSGSHQTWLPKGGPCVFSISTCVSQCVCVCLGGQLWVNMCVCVCAICVCWY